MVSLFGFKTAGTGLPRAGKKQYGRQATWDRGTFEQLYACPDPWGAARHAYRLRVACRALSGRERNVLDVGCGEGGLLALVGRHTSHAALIGVDLAHRAVARARTRYPRASYAVATTQSLPFPDRSLDAVLCLEVLYYLPSWEQGLDELGRVLAPHGTAVIGVTIGKAYLDYARFMREVGARFRVRRTQVLAPPPFSRCPAWLARQLLPISTLFPDYSPLKLYVVVSSPGRQ